MSIQTHADTLADLQAERDHARLEGVMRHLRANVRELFRVRYAPNRRLAYCAWAYYAELPPALGEDFADEVETQLRNVAGQFPKGTGVEKDAAVTRELQDYLNDA